MIITGSTSSPNDLRLWNLADGHKGGMGSAFGHHLEVQDGITNGSSSGNTSINLLSKQAQLHGHGGVPIMLNDVRLFNFIGKVTPRAVFRARIDTGTIANTIGCFAGRPPVREQSVLLLNQPQESNKAHLSILRTSVNAIVVDSATVFVLILDSHAVDIDQELVDIFFGPAMEPLFGVKFVERLCDVDLEGLVGSSSDSGFLGDGDCLLLTGTGSRSGLGLADTSLLVNLVVGYLAFTRTVENGVRHATATVLQKIGGRLIFLACMAFPASTSSWMGHPQGCTRHSSIEHFV